MAEINTVQAAKAATIPPTKLAPNEKHGRMRVLFAKLPTTFAQLAINDTIKIGTIPAGSRILSVKVSNATGTASSTLDVGLRKTDGTVIAAAGLATGIDTATAGAKTAENGTLITNGLDYTTPSTVEVYATAKGAVLAANQALAFTVHYVTD